MVQSIYIQYLINCAYNIKVKYQVNTPMHTPVHCCCLYRKRNHSRKLCQQLYINVMWSQLFQIVVQKRQIPKPYNMCTLYNIRT